MDAAERSSENLSVNVPSDIDGLALPDTEKTSSAVQVSSNAEDAASLLEVPSTDDEATGQLKAVHGNSYLQYTREKLLEIRGSPECRSPPTDWDISQSSELYEPGARRGHQHVGPPAPVRGQPVSDADPVLQYTKDSWRGKPASGNLANAASLPETELPFQQRKDSWRGKAAPQSSGFEEPIRSRLVENGYLGNIDPTKTVRQGSGPRAWPQQDDAEPNAYAGPPASSGRTLGRKESDQPERWNSGQAPGGDNWRGPPGLHGRGPGPEGRERQWGGRGPHQPPPPSPAGPVEIPGGSPAKPAERDAPQPRSLEKDWRTSKAKPGSAPGPSSKEWASYRSLPQDSQARPAGAGEQAQRQPHDRQRHGSRNNPEWMTEGAGAGVEDASGLSVAARRARDFEAERQRMKEEWNREQEQARGSANQPVSMSAFMTDEDLEALKIDSDDQASHAAQHKREQEASATASSLQEAKEDSGLAKFFGQPSPTGSQAPAQQSTGFDFKSLAQAAGQGLPQMPPMPKGVATLEDLERRARPPPGFAQPMLSPKVASQAPTSSRHAASKQSAPWTASDAQAANGVSPEESGKALLSLLSKAAPSAAPAEQPAPTAITPPPGFPAVSKQQASISWGSSSQLQGIWGAPSPSIKGSQPTWGAPAPALASRANSAHAQLPEAFPLQGHSAQQAAVTEAQSKGLFAPFMQTAASTPGSLPDQPESARQGRSSTAGPPNDGHHAESLPAQPESESISGNTASHAPNPLLALLGQHRSSATQGSKEQDPQLQAFLQAQSGAYSWHPPQAASKPQMQHPLLAQQQQQQQQQYLGQTTGPASNAALSQDLLRQLQLGQSRMQNGAPQAYSQLGHAGLHVYQATPPAYAQSPRSGSMYGGHHQPHLQAASQYGQQHQLPFNLGGAMPQTAYGQAQGQALRQQHVHQAQIPSHSFSHPLGSQANAHIGIDGQQYSSQRAPSNQMYGSSDLASQMLLQRLQQQQSYNQASQRGAGLDRFFNPTAFNASQAAHVPALPGTQASLAELEAMMARQ